MTSSIVWDIVTPLLPLVTIRHFLVTPPPHCACLVTNLLLRQNSLCWVPDHSWRPFTTCDHWVSLFFLLVHKTKYTGWFFLLDPPPPIKKLGHNRWLKMKLGRGFCHLFTPLVIMSSFVIFWLTPPPPHPVMTSFMNSPLEKQVVYWEISGWNNSWQSSAITDGTLENCKSQVPYRDTCLTLLVTVVSCCVYRGTGTPSLGALLWHGSLIGWLFK